MFVQHRKPQELSSKLLRHFRFWTQDLGQKLVSQVQSPGGVKPAHEAEDSGSTPEPESATTLEEVSS